MNRLIHIIIALSVLGMWACGYTTGGKPNTDEQCGAITIMLSDSLNAARTDTLEMGRIKAGETAVQKVVLKNTSAKPVVILDAETVCGCTEVDFPRKPIPAGASAEASVYLHSAGLQGLQIKPIAFRTSLGAERYRVLVIAEIY